MLSEIFLISLVKNEIKKVLDEKNNKWRRNAFVNQK